MEQQNGMGCINLRSYLKNNSQPYDQQIYTVLDPDSFINVIIQSYLGLLNMEHDNLLPYYVDLFLNNDSTPLFTTNGENKLEDWNTIINEFQTTTDTDLPNNYSPEEYHSTPCINITIKPSSFGGKRKSKKSQKKMRKTRKSRKQKQRKSTQRRRLNKKGGNATDFNVRNVDVNLLLKTTWLRSLDKHDRYVYLTEVINSLNDVVKSGKRSKNEVIQMMNNPEFLLKFYENVRDNLVSDGILAKPEIDFTELNKRFWL